LGPGDLFLLQARIGREANPNWKAWMIASAVWLLEGYVLMGNANTAPRIVNTIISLPKPTQEILFSIASGLFVRQTRALGAVESYCYESMSRYQWKTYGGQFIGHHSGIPGIETLGTNNIQRMWSFFNEIEDQRKTDEAMWEGFKLTVSPHSPKGVKKIDARDRELHQNEMGRRQAVQDKFYYAALGVLKPTTEPIKEISSNYGLAKKSVDDLADEMYRWVAGKDDAHDQIVKNYKQKITERYEEEQRQRTIRREMLQARRAKMEADLESPTKMVGYTSAQLSSVLKGRAPGHPGARTVIDGPPLREDLYKRYLERAPDSGMLKPEDGRLVVPEGHQAGDLMQQVAARKLLFPTESGE